MDDGHAWNGSPMTRIEWAKKFEVHLKRQHFIYKAKYWPGAGHGGDGRGNADLASEAFSLGTSGMAGKDRTDLDEKIKSLTDLAASGDATQVAAGCSELRRKISMRTAGQTEKGLSAVEWQSGPAGISNCMKLSQQFVADQIGLISSRLEKAGIEQVAAIESAPAPDSLARLQAVYNAFSGLTKVQDAARNASVRLQAKVH